MKELDQKIAMLEREQRRQAKEEVEEENSTPKKGLSMDEILEGLHKGSLKFPEKKELYFQTINCFPQKIPMIIIPDFYTDKEETEDVVIYVNNKEQVGQTLVHLPKDMDDLTVEQWKCQIQNGMKKQGMYADIDKAVSLPYLDYITYRIPSKKGWVYNLIYRIQRENRRIVGANNCMEKDKETYGQLLEAMIIKIQQLL